MLMPTVPIAGLLGGAAPDFTLDYDGDYADVDIFAACSSPAGDVVVVVNMADGTDFYASTTSVYACDCDGFTSGSSITFNMINSNISGQRGAAGAGGASGSGTGGAGGAGGPAIRLGCPTTFNETGTSAINGGGGGGGGGGGAQGGVGIAGEFGCNCSNQDAQNGGAGGAGQNYNTAAASGSAGGSDTYATGGTGGAGGAFGAAGSTGNAGVGSYTGCAPTGCALASRAGGAGGAAGNSIKTQSHAYTLNGVATNGSIVA